MQVSQKTQSLRTWFFRLLIIVFLPACVCNNALLAVFDYFQDTSQSSDTFWDAARRTHDLMFSCDSYFFETPVVNPDGTTTITWDYLTPYYSRIVNFYFYLINGNQILSETTTVIENWSMSQPSASVTLDIDWEALGNPTTLTAYVHVWLGLSPTGAYACPYYYAFSRPAPPAPPSFVCSNLHLTSPLDGLPNGFATFYWDNMENAVSYRINLYSGGNYLSSFEATAPNTSLQGDVSQGAIGGESPITVELMAFAADGRQCSQSYTIGREAAPPNLPPPVETEAPMPPPEETEVPL